MREESLGVQGDVELVPRGTMRGEISLSEELVQVEQVRLPDFLRQPAQLVVEVLQVIQVYGRVGEDGADHGCDVRDLDLHHQPPSQLGGLDFHFRTKSPTSK